MTNEQSNDENAGNSDSPFHIRDPELGTWTRKLVWWTRALVAAALISALIAALQWNELRIAGAQTDRTIAQLERQTTLMEADQRPWIGFFGINNLPNSLAKMIVLANGGKSPAMKANIVVFGGAEGDNALAIPSSPCDINCNIRGVELLPNVPISLRVPKVGEPDPRPDLPYWIVARIDYLDPAGRPHKTGFCFRVMPDAGHSITGCPDPYSGYAD